MFCFLNFAGGLVDLGSCFKCYPRIALLTIVITFGTPHLRMLFIIRLYFENSLLPVTLLRKMEEIGSYVKLPEADLGLLQHQDGTLCDNS